MALKVDLDLVINEFNNLNNRRLATGVIHLYK